MKGILILLALLQLMFYGCTALNQQQHASLTQRAEVACYTHADQHFLRFYLVVNSDNVDLIYTVNETDPTDVSVGTLDSNPGNGISGDGSINSPFTFVVSGTGNLPANDITLDANATIAKAYVTHPDVISVKVMVKAIYQEPYRDRVIFAEDVLYTATCNYSNVEEQVVSSRQLMVSGSPDESPVILVDAASLMVWSAPSSPVVNLTIGEVVQLAIVPDFVYRSTGLYAHTCTICDTSACDGVVVGFIGNDGCAIGNYISAFNRSSDNIVTEPFEAFILSNTKFLYITCLVNFCYEEGDTRCDNYCEYNTQGRRRRAAEDTQQTADTMVSASVAIIVEDDTILAAIDQQPQDPEQGSSGQQVGDETSTVMVVSVSVLTVLLVVTAVASVIVFCRMSTRPSAPKSIP